MSFSGRTPSLPGWTESWSTGGSTATSTESLPVDWSRLDNPVISVQIYASVPTITSSISRRIRTGTVALAGVEFRSNSRSYQWERRRKSWLTEASIVEPHGYQLATSKIRIFLRENAS